MDTISELLKKYPDGFAVGPGGDISKVVYATSRLSYIARSHPFPPPGGGYVVIEMVDVKSNASNEQEAPNATEPCKAAASVW